MQIRDLKWRALPMWPPEWFLTYQDAGELGVLEDVKIRHDIAPRLITVVANYRGETRRGIVVLEDFNQLEIIFYKLKDNIGKPLTEIGNLEIDYNDKSALSNKKKALLHYDCRQPVCDA
jgi:hypothetical protein